MRRYLAELVRLVEGSDIFQVLAHLDFPRRMWPQVGRPYDERAFEAEYRAVLRALAASDRVLEVNTKSPLVSVELLRWWREAGGPGGVVRQRRAPALAGRRQVQAGGRRGRGGGLPRRARPLRLLATVELTSVTGGGPGRPSAGGGLRAAAGGPQVQVSPKRATMSSQLSPGRSQWHEPWRCFLGRSSEAPWSRLRLVVQGGSRGGDGPALAVDGETQLCVVGLAVADFGACLGVRRVAGATPCADGRLGAGSPRVPRSQAGPRLGYLLATHTPLCDAGIVKHGAKLFRYHL